MSGQGRGPRVRFERFAGLCAIAAGGAALVYSMAFLATAEGGARPLRALSYVMLMVTGLLTVVIAVALYQRLSGTEPGAALCALAFGVAAGLGSAIHGSYDLAAYVTPPPSVPDLPNAIDPRGFTTFAVSGLSILVYSWLIMTGRRLPRRLGVLGYVLGAMLVLVYLARLTIVDPGHPVLLGAAAVTGLLVGPAWYVWLGLLLRRPRRIRRRSGVRVRGRPQQPQGGAPA